jgi:hypothetical protein
MRFSTLSFIQLSIPTSVLNKGTEDVSNMTSVFIEIFDECLSKGFVVATSLPIISGYQSNFLTAMVKKSKVENIGKTVHLKGQCHEIFDLCFFFIKQSHQGP